MKRNIFASPWLVLAAGLAFFFTACEREVTLDLEVPNQLVAFSNFSPDSIFRLHLSSAVPLQSTGNQLPEYPKDAAVELIEDGAWMGTFTFQDQDINSGYSPSYFLNKNPKPGSRYNLRIQAAGYPEVAAENTCPERIFIKDWKLLSQTSKELSDYEGYFQMTLNTELDLEIPPSATGYFHLFLWRNVKNYEVVDLDTIVYDTYLEDLEFSLPSEITQLPILHEAGVLADYRSNEKGQKMELNFTFEYDSFYELQPSIVLELRSVSEAYYLFHKSVGEQEVANFKENSLSLEASLVYNNLNNGIGNFSSYVAVVDSLLW